MVRSWLKLILNSLGAAAIAAAAQLGIAEALGIIRWNGKFASGGSTSWSALLTWIVFIYAVSVLGGAAVGKRAVRRPGRPEGAAARVTATLAAALGTGGAITLAWLPAHDAKLFVNVHPELVVAVAAAAGVLAGLVLSLVALFVPPVAGGVRASVAWIWLVAIGSAVAGIVTHRPYRAPRLAVVDAPSLVPVTWWSGPNLMIAVAAVLGFTVAGVARWGGAHRFGVALSGLAGPAVVAGAYLIAGAGDSGVNPMQAPLYAAGAGLVASTLIALPGRREPTDERDRAIETSLWADDEPYPPDRFRSDTFPPDTFRPEQPRPQGATYRAEPYHAQPYGSQPQRGEPYRTEPYQPAPYLGPDYPTDEYPAANVTAASTAPVMGQPPSEHESTSWFRAST